MSTKSGIVSATNLKKEGTGNYGKFYIHTVTITDDDGVITEGDYLAKSNPQTAFKVGQKCEYEYAEKQNGNYTNKTIKPVQQNGFAGKPFVKKDTKAETAILAASYAAAGQGIAVSSDQIILVAEKFLTWIKSKE